MTFAAFDSYMIFGTGPTREAAIDDAANYVEPDRLKDFLTEVETAEMSSDLAAQVANDMTTRFGRLLDGKIGTTAEYQAVWE